ncbi:MAG TPA: VWA domain-containing protein [Vicinamibacterales bacterium]|nr:VWA domain-containing protein [Vicinamibacterales bacterium]
MATWLTCAATTLQAGPQQAQEPPPARIKVAVDVVAVDVQVIDRSGQPVPSLGPESFTVTINGRRRRVLTAEQIRSDTAEGRAAFTGSPGSAVPGRVIMLAVDCISFDATASRDVIQHIDDFVRGLQPDDHVGLSVFPNGASIPPTTDHAAVLRALTTIVGQSEGAGLSLFHLRPTELIDMTRDMTVGTGPTLDTVVARECGRDPDPNCRYQLLAEVTSTAVYLEGQGAASLGMLLTLVNQMQGYAGRKTLILVSGGMVASDSPGGRPNLGSMGLHVGRAAAGANTAIYTLFIDSSVHDRFAAETRRGDRTFDNRARESAVLARWLEQFAGAAGGALFAVQGGNAGPALERIRNELSSYYLLGVEPADEDRDGRTHEVSVRVTRPNVTIRGRRWVMIPKRGASAPAADAPAPSASPVPAAPAEPPPRVVPPEVVALADVFDRGDREAFQQALLRADLTPLIRDFRMSDGPWPDQKRRTAVFALELALAGLRSSVRDARDEAGRLLAEYHVRLREPGGADEFECWWFVTEAAALQGLFMPENALQFIPRALQRCPASARLHLAHAFALEQQWLRGRTTAAQEAEIVSRYEDAMKFPETGTEARVRGARFLHGLGQPERALAVLDGIAKPSSDLEIQYFTHVIRGRVLRELGRAEDAAASFRQALVTWPGAQSARVALMTLLVSQGSREEAVALAEAVQTAPADQYDPWWTYWLGDYRSYPAISARLRELGQ